tara:strand:+ start:1287 stop:1451 length:165 start_codon:yes stop_codon:yes gene_type:complete
MVNNNDTLTKEEIIKKRRQKYNRRYYDKHRFKLLKIASDKLDASKGKIKIPDNY